VRRLPGQCQQDSIEIAPKPALAFRWLKRQWRLRVSTHAPEKSDSPDWATPWLARVAVHLRSEQAALELRSRNAVAVALSLLPEG